MKSSASESKPFQRRNSQLSQAGASIIQYNTIILFAFPFEIRLQEIYIYFLFYVKMLSNFEIIYSLRRKCLVPK